MSNPFGFRPGERIGKHGAVRIDRDIYGRNGGNCMAWTATYLGAREGVPPLIVKHPKEPTQPTAALFERFKREAEELKDLEHPNVTRYWYVGYDPDRELVYNVQTRWDGVDLGEVISGSRERRLTVQEALSVALHTMQGLACIHDRGIIHRDLKPGNIMITRPPESRAILIDFGLARFLGAPTITTSKDMPLGTAGYSSQNLIYMGRGDASDDFFSVGVILYEMLVGTDPFKRDSEMEMDEAVLGGVYKPLVQVAPHVPSEVEDFCGWLIGGNRPNKASEVLTRLEPLLATHGGVSMPAVPASP